MNNKRRKVTILLYFVSGEYATVIKKLLFLGLLSCSAAHLQAVVAVGDTEDSSTTFQFSVGSGIYNSVTSQLFTLSGQDLPYPDYSNAVRSYGISYTKFISVDNASTAILTAYPYLTSQAVVTTTDEEGNAVAPVAAVENPLLGQAYSGVTFLGASLTAVNTLSPRYVYMIQSQSVYFYDSVLGKQDPEGICTINQLDLGLDHQAKVIAGSGGSVLFIAQAQGTFGTDSSDISFATAKASTPSGKTTSYTVMVHQADESVELSTPVVTAGGADVASIGSSVVMYPSLTTAYQMYVGLDVTAGITAAHHAVGLFTASAIFETSTTSASILFGSVLPDDVVTAGFNTPVSTSEGNSVAIKNITTTVTSTGLSYLINSYADGVDRQFIYAMPMVTKATTGADNGKIANFDDISQTFQISGSVYRSQGFETVIDDAEQIDINSVDTAIISRMKVGGGPVPLPLGQYIDQLMALGDAVYITIHDQFGTNATPGLFKSQALFDAQGRIMSWSPWQRVAGSDDQMLLAIQDRTTDATMFVSGADSDTIQQTTWNNSTDLTSAVTATASAMTVGNGGVQGLLAVSNHTPYLSGFPLLITTGNGGVVITQTGSKDAYDNIVIDTPQNTVTLNSSFGLSIGSVVTATFSHNEDTENNWFFMGGDAGLSVLSGDTTGYTFNGELDALDSLIAADKSCKTLGSFSFVKKVVSHNDYLYVLTPSAVYRIIAHENKFKLVPTLDLNPELVIAASTVDAFASCTDMLVDDGVLLLGTTAGMYSLDISGALPATPISIEIPGGLPAVSRMVTISNHANFNQSFYDSSNLYVLTINYALQQARLNRFTITDGVVAPIQDQLFADENGPLLIFSYMSNNIFIDGSLGFATSYRVGTLPPTLKYMEYTLQAGRSSSQSLVQSYTANLSITAIVKSLGLAGVLRDYASGCLVLGADFGILTNS